jgi:general secretion pathway protein H
MMRKDEDNGFSLLEMLVVLAIISLLGLVGFSGFTGNKQTQSLKTITRDVQSLVALTSFNAISARKTQSLLVDISNLRISADQDGRTIQLPRGFKLNLLTGAELIREDNTASIDFYNDGTSSGGELSIIDANGVQQTIRILWLTGAIVVTDK